MYCPRCQATVASGKKFCGDCGTPLPWLCHVCGSENPARSRFCGECGTRGTSIAGDQPNADAYIPPAAREPERRQLTVVFADLAGSTDLGSRLDPEDLRDVIGAWRNCVTALVVRFGGQVTRHMGDGVLAFFGYPRAHETDAECGVRAGLAIIEAVGRLDTAAGPPGTLKTRIGLATGLVIVGDLIGAGSSLEWSIVGTPPNLAARLQSIAQPDMLVIDAVTHQLTGGMFEYANLGRFQLKGIPGAIQPWAVLRETAVQSRFAALRTGPLPLVGREEEAGMIRRRWTRAVAGVGHVVVLVGEPGLGKSRLIAAFEDSLGNTPRSVLRLACSPHYQDTPLYPFIRYFETAAGFQQADGPEQRFRKLEALLRTTQGLGDEELAALAELLAIPLPARPLAHHGVQSAKELTFRAISLHISALAADNPLLTIVEDFHWADPTTTALLDGLVGHVERLSTLFIISTRPEKGLLWSLRPHVTTQLLNGLDRGQAAVLVRHVTGERQFADELVARIVERAEGVPLFIEELTRSFLASASPGDAGAEESPVMQAAVDAVPTSLKGLLMAKLDELGSGKEVAQASSVIGREFSFGILEAVTNLPTDRLESALDKLEAAGMIVPDGPPPNATYVFRHALIQDAAYASMLRERRRSFHLRYAQALETDETGPASRSPELLAAHFAEAGATEQSVAYYLKAAARATGRFALTEIVGYLQKGLSQVANLPATVVSQARELELQVERGRALMEHRGAGDAEVRATFERAHELCLVLGETKLLLHVIDGLANYHLAHSELDKVVEYGERALEIGRKSGDRHALVLAHRTLGYGRWLLGRFREACVDLEETVRHYEGEMAITRDPKVSVVGALSICQTVLGLPESGWATSLAAIRYAEALNHPVSLTLALRRACVQAVICRDIQQVQDLSRRLLDLQSDYETFRGTREGMFFTSWARVQRDTQLDRSELKTILDRFEGAGLWNLLPFFMIVAAELAGSRGDTAGAEALLQRAARLIEKTGERWCEPEIPRLRAHLAEDTGAAVRLLQTSLTLAHAQDALFWEIRAATDLARLLRSMGKGRAAHDVLQPVVARMQQGYDIPDFRTARELLEELRDDLREMPLPSPTEA